MDNNLYLESFNFFFSMGPFFFKIKNVQSFPLKLKTALRVSKVTPENILKPLTCMNASSFISRTVKVQHHLWKWKTKTGITFRKLCQKIGRNYLTISFKCSMNKTVNGSQKEPVAWTRNTFLRLCLNKQRPYAQR